MPERERGLPASSFKLELPDDEMFGAASPTGPKLKSFLDEIVEKAENAAERVAEEKPAQGARPARSMREPERVPESSGAAALAAPIASQRPRPVRPVPQFVTARALPRDERTPRITLNLAGDAKQSLRLVLSHFEKYGPDGKSYASEVLGGLIEALAVSLRDLDLRGVAPRGAWGSPAAEQHREQVRDRIMHAIARRVSQTQGEL